MSVYYHGECLGCKSYGVDCEPGCEYNDDPNECKCFAPREEPEGEDDPDIYDQ